MVRSKVATNGSGRVRLLRNVRKTLERELEWVRQGTKRDVSAKSKARLASYDKLMNEDQKVKEDENLEIYIPNGPRLG